MVVLLGGTYAIFGRIDEANIANNYKTGNLHITIDDTSEGLGGNLDMPSIPLSDEEGSTLAPYKFKVINKGNLWYEYYLKLLTDMLTLENDGCTDYQIPLNYIKVKINDEEPKLLSELENNTIIQDEILPPLKENYYEVRIWLDESAPNSVIGSHFHGKITTEGYAIQPFEMVTNFEYTGDYQEYIVPYNGIYQIELWGAAGAYTKGIISLKKNEVMYLYLGGRGKGYLKNTTSTKGYNGGGEGGIVSSNYRGGGGNGATDVRYFGNITPSEEDFLWNSDLGLKSRIMVAAGGGGSRGSSYGAAGGLIGYTGPNATLSGYYVNGGTGGNQISGGNGGASNDSGGTGGKGSFGIGGTGGYGNYHATYNYGGSGGGGGYYGGGGTGGGGFMTGGETTPLGGGGSSFISGHTGCVAIISSESITARVGTNGVSCTTGTADNLCSIHYSGKYFTDTLMIDGKGFTWTNVKEDTVGTNLMPNPLGDYYASGVGHSGNGYARITFVG